MQRSRINNDKSQDAQQSQVNTSPSSIRILSHFKNCIHDGFFTQSMKREGPGISILDNDCIVLGNYKNDNNVGMTLIFLNYDTYFIGQFNKGALDGPFVIRSPSLTIYSSFSNNKIENQLLMLDYDDWIARLWVVQANGEGKITKQLSLNGYMNSFYSYQQIKRIENKVVAKVDKTKYIPYQQQILKQVAPYIEKMPTISQFIKSLKSATSQLLNFSRQPYLHKFYQDNEIILLNGSDSNVNQFLSMVLNKKQEVVAFGQFKEIQFTQKSINRPVKEYKDKSYENIFSLNGLGVLVENIPSKSKDSGSIKTVYSGQFLNHKLHGEGTKHIIGQKAIYGKFMDGNIRNTDVIKFSNKKDEQIKNLELKLRKSIHIHSLKFYNNYSNQRPIYILHNLLEELGKQKSRIGGSST